MLYLLRMTVGYLLDATLLIMLISALLSFVRPAPNRFTDFINDFTDMLCRPLRILLNRFDFIRTCPLDLSFLFTWILLELLRRLL